MTPFLQLILTLIIIIAGAKAGGWLANRLRQPAVLGELLIGLLLGPSLLDVMGWPILANPTDPRLLSETVFELADLGVVCLVFLAGLEIDAHEMRRTGRVSTFVGVSGVLMTLALGGLAALAFGYRGQATIFIGMILAATSVSISAQTLLELGLLRSREGLTLLGAAVIDDVLVILLLATFTALADHSGSGAVVTALLKMVAYLSLAALAGFFLLPRLAEWIHRQPISEGLAALVLVVVLTFAWSAEVVGGLAAITGAFIAGVGFGRSHLRDEIERGMHTITYTLLVPIFFVSIGLRANVHVLSGPDVLFALVLLLVAVLSKVVGCGLGARLGEFTNREALRVGVGMICRGEVQLIVASLGVGMGLIKAELFAAITLIVLVTTLVTPPLLRLTFSTRADAPLAAAKNKEASRA